ncbi:MAG: hypothetical protein J6S14_21940 [Clostridia bacterium]|nr:hypothetical protein [Clostridia bacterium]
MEEAKVQGQAAEEAQGVNYEAEYKKLLGEHDKLKASFDSTASSVARLKKELAEHSTKEENERREREAEAQKLQEELEMLRAEKRRASYTSKLQSAGITPDTAERVAGTLPEGIPDTFFTELSQFMESEKSRIKADLLKTQPPLTPGITPTASIPQKDTEAANYRRWMGLK